MRFRFTDAAIDTAAARRELIEEGLRHVLEGPHKARRQRDLADLMKRARGVVDSGVPDLASNPRHLAGFGRDARHR